ncbi:MAG: P-II family nitrogen regulator [bacterium]
MKMIVAYIKPNKLDDVKKELYAVQVFKMSVINALGCGRQQGHTEMYRGLAREVNLLMKTRLEIAVNEDFVKPTIMAIIKGAQTGNIGDGKIFVTELADCVRISTGETGGEAI